MFLFTYCIIFRGVLSLPKGITCKKISTPSKEISLIQGTKKTIYFCSYCQNIFDSQSALSSHIKNCEKVKTKHICKYCDKNFASATSLRKHLETHETTPEHYCPKCGKIFTNDDSKQVHLDTCHTAHFDYTSGGQFQCKFCSVKYSTRKNIIRHIGSHGIVTPSLCDICGKSFGDKKKLDLHQITHQNEKPFNCDVCSKSFKMKKTLNAHKKIHLEDFRIFVCDQCGRSFRQKFSFECHKKMHSGDFEFQCYICEKKFVTKTAGAAHLKRHKIVD